MAITTVVEGIIDYIDKNIIAKTNVTSNVLTGDVLVNVENAFHMVPDQEIVLIDYGYNIETSPHYLKFEYARIKEVNNTHWITLYAPVEDTTGWLVANRAFIQKTIGSTPLYSSRILYGDRDVIPTEEMAVAVEPVSVSNEWLYIHGGLSEEYRISIIIYGKDIETEDGMKVLNKYTDAIYKLFNDNMHINLNDHESPLLANVPAGSTQIVVADTVDNRIYFKPSSAIPDDQVYEIQDNIGTEIDLFVTSVLTPGDGKMYITVNYNNPAQYGIQPLARSYFTEEFGIFKRHGMYFYDSRIDNGDIGQVQKGSAYIRAAKLNWFGKTITEHRFPQKSLKTEYFAEIQESSSSSES